MTRTLHPVRLPSSGAWPTGGGVTAGTHGAGRTVCGEMPLGKGTVHVLAALLPQPSEEHDHPYGLQSHGLQNMLER